MKILFIGDIVGEPGRRAVKQLLPFLIQQESLDLVVANGENTAGGSGITKGTAEELFSSGVDVITTGDHIWDQKEILGWIGQEKRLLRPLNYPLGIPGTGSIVLHKEGLPSFAVVNILGRVFMPEMDNPFLAIQSEIQRIRQETTNILVDFHAEATSEKIAMGRFLDGLVSAVVGTHTHVQTADEQIFPAGTAYISDVGFTGPHESVLGREIEPVIKRFLTCLPQRFPVASGNVLLQGVIIEVDPMTGRSLSIKRVSQPLPPPPITKSP